MYFGYYVLVINEKLLWFCSAILSIFSIFLEFCFYFGYFGKVITEKKILLCLLCLENDWKADSGSFLQSCHFFPPFYKYLLVLCLLWQGNNRKKILLCLLCLVNNWKADSGSVLQSCQFLSLFYKYQLVLWLLWQGNNNWKKTYYVYFAL